LNETSIVHNEIKIPIVCRRTIHVCR
jgi:hypothetical protein